MYASSRCCDSTVDCPSEPASLFLSSLSLTMLTSASTHASSLQEQLTPPSHPSHTSSPPSRSLKLHQAWPARTHPLCGGRLLLGPHWLNLLFNMSLTIALAVLFCVYTAWPMHWSLIIPCIVFTVLAEAMLLSAALTDPGIVARAVENQAEDRKRRRWEEARDNRITDETRRALGMSTRHYDADYPPQIGYFPTAQYQGTALPPTRQQQQSAGASENNGKGEEEEKSLNPTGVSRAASSSTVAPAPLDTATQSTMQRPPPYSYQPPHPSSPPAPQTPPSPYIVPTQRIHSFDPRTQRPIATDIPLKFCSTCHVYRPYGASHCRDCDSCVRGFDHRQLHDHTIRTVRCSSALITIAVRLYSHSLTHSSLLSVLSIVPDCPWIGTCVGERNHRYFVAFVLSLTVLTCYVFVVSLVDVIRAGVNDDLGSGLGGHIVALVECVFTFVVGWCFISLSGYQCYLIAEHTTTNAHIKEQRDERQRQAQLAWERHRAYAQRVQGAAGPPLHQQSASALATTTSATSEPSPLPPTDDGTPIGRSGGAEEAMVGAITGSTFTAGTQPNSPSQPVDPSMEHTIRLYPDAEAFRVSHGVLDAYRSFFCSRLPPSSVDMDSEVLVDQHNKIIAYSRPTPAP